MKSYVSPDECGKNFAQRLAFVSIESTSRYIIRGRSALHLALSTKGMENIVADLLSIEGIDVPFFLDENGKTPLDASNNEYSSIFNPLYYHGAVPLAVSDENCELVER